MKENEILEEIHRVRAEHAAEYSYDVNVMFTRMEADLERLQPCCGNPQHGRQQMENQFEQFLEMVERPAA